MFFDRTDAGKKLANELSKQDFQGFTVVGIAYSGLIVAKEVAATLHMPLKTLHVARKINFKAQKAILVDDEIISGYTVDMAVNKLHGAGVKEIVVACPVISAVVEREVICLKRSRLDTFPHGLYYIR